MRSATFSPGSLASPIRERKTLGIGAAPLCDDVKLLDVNPEGFERVAKLANSIFQQVASCRRLSTHLQMQRIALHFYRNDHPAKRWWIELQPRRCHSRPALHHADRLDQAIKIRLLGGR
jgi:hypothetical protein